MLNSMQLYEKIEKIRIQKGIPVAKLNKATGLSHSTLSSWKYRQTMPKLETLDSICFALEIPLAELLFDVSSDIAPNLVKKTEDETGFLINKYDIVFSGTCKDCLKNLE